ncbi:hypothetical protein HDU85_002289 [Gaertneriomyces sp. JEL0708]|nr:hypothetical protein HDU85_002289 [Gaertneriomyces sp. JEL0708]
MSLALGESVENLNKAVAMLYRNCYDGNRVLNGDHFYVAVREFEDRESYIKLGMVHSGTEDADERLEEHEKTCAVVVNQSILSAYLPDVENLKKPLQALLSNQGVTLSCACKRDLKEYFTKSEETVQTITQFWWWCAENPIASFFDDCASKCLSRCGDVM